MSRRGDRAGESPEVRTRMLEDDLDRAEENIVTAKRELEGKVEHAKRNATLALEGVKMSLGQQITDLRGEFAGLRAEMITGFKECEDRDDQTRKLLTGLLVSIVTLCVTVTVGVLVALGGG